MFGRLKLFAMICSKEPIAEPSYDRLAKESMSRQAGEALVQQLAQETIKLREENEGLKSELEMTDDLLTDAAKIATRYQNTLVQVRDTIGAVNSPNGTTQKLGRIVNTGLGDISAAPLGELSRRGS